MNKITEPQKWPVTVNVTREMRDAARQAGLEGREAEWAEAVLAIQAEAIVCSHRNKATRHMVVNENRREGGVVGWCVVRDKTVFTGNNLHDALRRAGVERAHTVEGECICRGEEATLGEEVLRAFKSVSAS